MRCGLVLALLFMGTFGVVAEEVVLTSTNDRVKVTIDGDVFTVYCHGADLPKPYFLPVTSAQAWDFLDDAEFGDETVAGRTAFVCDAQLAVKQNGEVRQLPFGTIVQVNDVDEEYVRLLESDGRVPRSALAPIAGTVTRLVNPHPSNEKDRLSPQYYDHPHHKGVWLSVDEVNENKHWVEKGRIVSQSVEIVEPKGNPAIFKTVNHWLKEDGTPLVVQTTTYTIFADRLLGCDTTFTAMNEPVTFGDTKEGMFAIRLCNNMREFVAGGPVTNAEGIVGAAACWGKESNWIDYVGKVDEQVLGVALLDHPENPRRSRYHVRDYGLFAINPFGAHAYTNGESPEQDMHLEPGQTGAHFRFGLYVHVGQLPDGAMAARYEKFVSDLK